MFVPADSLTIGPLQIYWYSVFLLTGIIGGYFLARLSARRAGLSDHQLQVSLLIGIIGGIIGARAYHVASDWSLYAAQPWQALAIWNGGLGIFGGLAGGTLGLWLFARRYRKPLLSVLDVWAPSVLLGQAIGRLGNWTNQEAFGPPTDGPLGIYIDPVHRPEQYAGSDYFHPTFFYEAAWDIIGLVILLFLRPRLPRKPGAVLGAYFIIYGSGRLVAEFYRFDTAEVAGIAVGHMLSLALIILGAYLLWRKTAKATRS